MWVETISYSNDGMVADTRFLESIKCFFAVSSTGFCCVVLKSCVCLACVTTVLSLPKPFSYADVFQVAFTFVFSCKVIHFSFVTIR